jgi:hypothetical protein
MGFGGIGVETAQVHRDRRRDETGQHHRERTGAAVQGCQRRRQPQPRRHQDGRREDRAPGDGAQRPGAPTDTCRRAGGETGRAQRHQRHEQHRDHSHRRAPPHARRQGQHRRRQRQQRHRALGAKPHRPGDQRDAGRQRLRPLAVARGEHQRQAGELHAGHRPDQQVARRQRRVHRHRSQHDPGEHRRREADAETVPDPDDETGSERRQHPRHRHGAPHQRVPCRGQHLHQGCHAAVPFDVAHDTAVARAAVGQDVRFGEREAHEEAPGRDRQAGEQPARAVALDAAPRPRVGRPAAGGEAQQRGGEP